MCAHTGCARGGELAMTTSGGRKVATTKTDHKSVAAPQTSLCPPTPPGAPVPTPFSTSSQSKNAQGTGEATTFPSTGKPVTKESWMPTDGPGNQSAAPTGGDIASHGTATVAGNMEVTSGSSRTLVDGKGIATTGDSVAMNKPSPKGG